MHFSIRHETLYSYTVPVTFAPHVLRLRPRCDGVRIRAESLSVAPMPSGRRDSIDRFGNRITEVEFDGACDYLRIESCVDLDTCDAAPLLRAELPLLPWPSLPQDELAEYRPDDGIDGAVRAFAATLASESHWSALPFLERLNRTMFTSLERRIRSEGSARAPAYTLATGRGACRDLTVLFMVACRSLGMAARFVSGYQAEADTPDGQRHMHAWPEVFLPALGWRGFDPTHGIAVTDGHVALCAAPDQAATMPVEGGFYANGVTARLRYRVEIMTT